MNDLGYHAISQFVLGELTEPVVGCFDIHSERERISQLVVARIDTPSEERMPDLKAVVTATFKQRAADPSNSQAATAISILSAMSKLELATVLPADYRDMTAALSAITLLGLPAVARCVENQRMLAELIALGLGADVPQTMALIDQLVNVLPDFQPIIAQALKDAL